MILRKQIRDRAAEILMSYSTDAGDRVQGNVSADRAV